MIQESIETSWHVPGQAEEPCVLQQHTYEPAERVKRAILGLVACWLIAGLTVFIPVFHFVLVPGFVVIGIGLAIRNVNTVQVIAAARGRCSACNTVVDGKMSNTKPQFPMWCFCSNCNERLKILAPAAPMIN